MKPLWNFSQHGETGRWASTLFPEMNKHLDELCFIHSLHTEGVAVQHIEMNLRQSWLSLLADPNVAYMLLMLGAAGIFFEIATPGVVLPGVVGGISLLLGMYALQLLPVNYAGLALMALAGLLRVGQDLRPQTILARGRQGRAGRFTRRPKSCDRSSVPCSPA